MKHILFTWILSVIIGSSIGPLFIAGLIPEIWRTIAMCIVISGLWSLPLVLVEVITWELIKRKTEFNAWIRYSWIKYSVAILTLLSVGLENFSGFKWGMMFLVGGFYGVPGLALHILFLRKKLRAQRKKYTKKQSQPEAK